MMNYNFIMRRAFILCVSCLVLSIPVRVFAGIDCSSSLTSVKNSAYNSENGDMLMITIVFVPISASSIDSADFQWMTHPGNLANSTGADGGSGTGVDGVSDGDVDRVSDGDVDMAGIVKGIDKLKAAGEFIKHNLDEFAMTDSRVVDAAEAGLQSACAEMNAAAGGNVGLVQGVLKAMGELGGGLDSWAAAWNDNGIEGDGDGGSSALGLLVIKKIEEWRSSDLNIDLSRIDIAVLKEAIEAYRLFFAEIGGLRESDLSDGDLVDGLESRLKSASANISKATGEDHGFNIGLGVLILQSISDGVTTVEDILSLVREGGKGSSSVSVLNRSVDYMDGGIRLGDGEDSVVAGSSSSIDFTSTGLDNADNIGLGLNFEILEFEKVDDIGDFVGSRN